MMPFASVPESVIGTSRHFAAIRNLVAIRSIADIDQPRQSIPIFEYASWSATSSLRFGAARFGPLLLQFRDEVLQGFRRRSCRTVGEADLALYVDVDLAHGDIGIGARHAFGNDGNPDAGGNQRHRPVFRFS